jgi:hypothetical protein
MQRRMTDHRIIGGQVEPRNLANAGILVGAALVPRVIDYAENF